MIIVPEIEKVIILVPRTGTTSLKSAVLKRYPKSVLLYRHMEADGVPMGYDRWQKIGVVRHPEDRLWSLYNYLRDFYGPYHKSYIETMRGSVKDIDFSSWIINNRVVFTNGFSEDCDRYFPKYTVRYSLPENRKSQFVYLRPDLGTAIYRYDKMDLLESDLGLKLEHLNRSSKRSTKQLTEEAKAYVSRFFKWDLSIFKIES